MGNREDVINARLAQEPKQDEEVAYIVDDQEGDGFNPGVDDLKQVIKKTMGDYLNCVTAEAKNAYVIDAGSSEIKMTDEGGYPSAIRTGDTNDALFTNDLAGWVHNFLDRNSPDFKTSDYLAKGKTPDSSNKETGNSLLSSITGEDTLDGSILRTSVDGDTVIEKQISQVLRSNRFNPTPGATPYVDEGEVPSVAAIIRDTVGVSEGGVEISFDKLSKQALSLMLMATGDSDGSKDPSNVTGLRPTGVQLGVNRLSRTEMNVREAFASNDVERTSLPSELNGGDQDPDFYSYGQLNNHLEPFSGFAPVSMVSLAAAQVVALITGSETVLRMLDLIASNNNSGVRLEPGPYVLGEYGRPGADGILGALVGPAGLGLINTENDFFEAARRGTNVFFGFDGDNITGASKSTLINIAQSPGYYAVLGRNVLRSLNTITNGSRDVGFDSVSEGVQSVIGLIDIIRSSKIISFYNVMAGIGDLVIKHEQLGFNVSVGQKNIASYVDALPDRPVTRVMKNRSKDGTSKLSLAWRASSAPAMYILPASVIAADTLLGGNTRLLEGTVGDYQSGKFKLSEVNRISGDDVRAMEDALESEYVPFYFHDLRTNEITSFHAFLGSLTEDYAPEYVDTDSYGRIDSVKTYKKTKRTISLSFHVASTSEEDFDALWWRVNKLITLLYPQWSPGRRLTNDATGESFTQPFSQIPTASPMIRMRIGDLIKSNYSKFNIARLFGLGRRGFSSGQNQNDFELSSDIEIYVNRARNLIKRMSQDPDTTNGGFEVSEQAILKASRGHGYFEADIPDVAGFFKKKQSRRRVKLPADLPVVVIKKETKSLNSSRLNTSSVSRTVYTVQFADGGVDGLNGVNQLEVTHGDLRIDPEYVIGASELRGEILNQLGNANSDSVQETQSFFAAENNVVIKSFESTMGRGLAGFITSMNFDWYKPTWETNGANRRAPQWCLVTMNFDVIHDIAPGLDADGFNRAPVYNVGSIMGRIFGDVYDSKDQDTLNDLVKNSLLELTQYVSRIKETQ